MFGERTVILGAPRAGKTTLALNAGMPLVRHLDDLVTLPWSEQSDAGCEWLEVRGPWIVEGCAGSRVLRKWCSRVPGKPCDAVIRLERPRPEIELTKGQRSLLRGEATIWGEIVDELVSRGVAVTYR